MKLTEHQEHMEFIGMSKAAAIGIFLWGVIILLMLAFCKPAKADAYIPVTFGNGTYFNSVYENRAWTQKGFDARYEPDTPVWSIGVGYKFRPWLAAELVYHDLGKYSQFGAFSCDDAGTTCGPTQYTYSETRTQAVSASGLFSAYAGGVEFFFRAGFAKWKSPWRTYYSDGTSHSHTFNMVVSENDTGWTNLFGVGASYNKFTLELQRFGQIKPRNGSIQGICTVQIGYRF